MTWLDIAKMVLDVFLVAWKNRQNPEVARLRAAAAATEALHAQRASFRSALADNDAAAMAEHFQALRDRMLEHVPGKSLLWRNHGPGENSDL